jgi:hypothetical protein
MGSPPLPRLTYGRVIRHANPCSQQVYHRLTKTFCLSIGQPVKCPQHQDTLYRSIRILFLSPAWTVPFHLRMPALKHFFTDPQRQSSTPHQAVIVGQPIPYLIARFLGSWISLFSGSCSLVSYASSLLQKHSFNNAQQNPKVRNPVGEVVKGLACAAIVLACPQVYCRTQQ